MYLVAYHSVQLEKPEVVERLPVDVREGCKGEQIHPEAIGGHVVDDDFPVVPDLFPEIVDVGGAQVDAHVSYVEEPGEAVDPDVSRVEDLLVDADPDRDHDDRVHGNDDNEVVPADSKPVLAGDDAFAGLLLLPCLLLLLIFEIVFQLSCDDVLPP